MTSKYDVRAGVSLKVKHNKNAFPAEIDEENKPPSKSNQLAMKGLQAKWPSTQATRIGIRPALSTVVCSVENIPKMKQENLKELEHWPETATCDVFTTKPSFSSINTSKYEVSKNRICMPKKAQDFKIYYDEPEEDQEVAENVDLPGEVVSLHRAPLATIETCSPYHMDESPIDSPMVLDTTCMSEDVHDTEKLMARNILFVPEYAHDIYHHLLDFEKKFCPKPNYMRKQPDITHGMRSILVDWLVEVAEEYKLHTETLYLAVSYIDRFLSCMSVLRSKLQLVGTASMFIASKYEEIYPPDVGEFVYITDDTYTKKQVLRMEHLILKVLSFDLAVPTINYFLERFCYVGQIPEIVEYLAKYLCELSLVEGDQYLRFLPSVIAAAAVCLANHTGGMIPWDENLATSSGYAYEDIQECVKCLYDSIHKAPSSPQQAIREKYKSSKNHSVSLMPPPQTIPYKL
ncbi:G2/mitotic-specific cyclin-A-like [Limulus polyphemus]|uniref:G2/mitotic-specific cyclin-A-like n=1 Tax=Limulus polyphemus TaxID=6850 RepID=A0ABM1B4W6_LIMPO|nr:G2/mitotic-specific cyclin-A-like [Limulus polyphemus]XP_022242035.1 G2/mitotic-specific cyclin-A-like [Limulus polyphemus]